MASVHFFKHPDVINFHSLWKDCGLIWISGPIAADRYVQQQMKILIERSRIIMAGGVPGGLNLVQAVIDIPFESSGFPFQGKHVKAAAKIALGQRVAIAAGFIIGIIAAVMQRTLNLVRLVAEE